MEEVKKQGMESLFCPYEIALALKELGFNENCIGYYADKTGEDKNIYTVSTVHSSINTMSVHFNVGSPSYQFSAPTYSQAFRWFREKYNMFSHLDKNVYNKYYYDIHNRGEIFFREEYSDTPEEAELACLKKLIEIVKTLPQ